MYENFQEHNSKQNLLMIRYLSRGFGQWYVLSATLVAFCDLMILELQSRRQWFNKCWSWAVIQQDLLCCCVDALVLPRVLLVSISLFILVMFCFYLYLWTYVVLLLLTFLVSRVSINYKKKGGAKITSWAIFLGA